MRDRLAALTMAAMISGCRAPEPAAGSGNLAALAATPSVTVTPSPEKPAVTDPVASRLDFGTLAGRWRVTAVAVEQGQGVQALVKNDPSYMGRELTIAEERLAWAGGEGGSTDDVCETPVLQRQAGAAKANYLRANERELKELGVASPDPHAIECLEGSWGSEGDVILYPAGDDLVMTWYDGAVLQLSRVS